MGREASFSDIKKSVQGDARTLEIFEKFQSHLKANGVDLGKTPAQLGPWLELDPEKEKFVAGDTLRVKSSRFDPGGKGINVSRVVRELGGHATGRDVLGALDSSILTPTYKGGLVRQVAIDRLRVLEESAAIPSVALGDLGPPQLSKYLFELYLIFRVRELRI